MLQYHIICSSTTTVSKIPKWDRILNCCSDYPIINAPFLESSEQLNRFLPASFHKIKSHIFQKISKFSIHRFRPLRNKIMCEFCDIIPDKYKKGRIMVKKCFVLHKELIAAFRKFFYIPTIENFHFILLMSGLLVQWNVGILEMIVSAIMHQLKKNLNKDCAEKINEANGIEIQIQH